MADLTLKVRGVCKVCHTAFEAKSDIVDEFFQQERERVERLETALNEIWINPMTAELAQAIAGAALVEDDRKAKAALKEQEATDDATRGS